MLKAERLQNVWDHYIEQVIWTVKGQNIFNLLMEVSRIEYIETIVLPIGTNTWNVEIYLQEQVMK